jgi:hypothetical protein
MTERKYEIGLWYPHDGGPCPVPKKSKVVAMWSTGVKGDWRADDIDHNWPSVVAFCVTDYPDEEETRTGTCWASPTLKTPIFWRTSPSYINGLVKGTYTVTLVNGKPKRIVWDADQ